MSNLPSMYNLFLFRKDLRLKDNPALLQAFVADLPLILLYIYDHKVLTLGTNSSAFRCKVVAKLHADLDNHLFIREGDTEDVLTQLVQQYQVQRIFVNDNTEPALVASLNFQDAALRDKLCIVTDQVLDLQAVERDREKPYVKFTYFYRKVLKTQAFVAPLDYDLGLAELLPQLVLPSTEDQAVVQPPESLIDLDNLYPNIDELAAETQLTDWYTFFLPQYGAHPKNLYEDPSSAVSHLLVIGLLSKRKLLAINTKHLEFLASQDPIASKSNSARRAGCNRFQRNLIWNEFCRYMHQHYPDMEHSSIIATEPLVLKKDKLVAWCQGATGCPLVDLAINHLIGRGYLPNVLRLIVASYLINIYKLPWQYGAQFFQEHLIDADPAANAFNWQFVAKTLPSNSLRSITRFDNKLHLLDPHHRFEQVATKLAQQPNIQQYKRKLGRAYQL